jgi:deoxyribodipyrimidine photo-lyase
MTKTIVWFRQDLRLSDNHALFNACQKGEVIPLFILDGSDRPLGSATKWWLHHSLKALGKSLGTLIFRRGDPLSILQSLLNETEAEGVYWNRGYEPHTIKRDTAIKSALSNDGIDVQSFCGSVVREPWETKTGSGGPYKVYTPFWKNNLAMGIPLPIAAPSIRLASVATSGENLDDWRLLPTNPDWAKGWEKIWTPGETGAARNLFEFLQEDIKGYGELRNRPDLPNISRLAPHIHFGELSPRQICASAYQRQREIGEFANDIDKFVAQIGWRDFANHLLFHFPDIPTKNWKPAFDDYPWRESETDLKAWQQGMTGYPMVDAGMRELWHTGYMHNRIRMLVGSFLVKHLQIHWSHGEAWFWDTLLDADLANNTSSWQWISGSGADAAPYFRIFNPITQGPKFDPNGKYVRKWCPELSQLPDQLIHRPHEASQLELEAAGIQLGKTYPHPIVEHKQARIAALAGYEAVKSAQAAKTA